MKSIIKWFKKANRKNNKKIHWLNKGNNVFLGI
jgi:hypothetical protein